MSKIGRKDYEIGYGRPPKNQFKKGQSGNPRGRPKRAKSLSDRLKKALSETVTINENGSRRKIQKSDALMIQLANKAVGGDIRSLRLVLELIGPLSEQGRQVELEASYQEKSTARETLAKKLDQMRERLDAGRPLLDDTDTK
jgi:Family of unknown function (DUF5681)